VRIAIIGGGAMGEAMVKCLLAKKVAAPQDMVVSDISPVRPVLGSTRTVEKTGKHPADLRNMVTSPGGTTTEALLQLEKGRFRSLILEAVAAACKKAERL
jgi:pyrroline-5-carboxylate reductase